MAIVTEFDAPIYKVLANNDTGAAKARRVGFALPNDLEGYLPLLRNQTAPLSPTVDVEITADLFDGEEFLGTAETRYQYQTRGGERSPELRVCGSALRAIRKARP